MPFTIQQTIIPPTSGPPTSWWKDAPVWVLLALIAIPILVIGIGALLVLIVVGNVLNAGAKIILPIRKLFGYQPPPEPPPVPEVPVVLFQDKRLRLLITTEHEWDDVGSGFETWFQAWNELEARGRFPGLYRLHTAPEIPGLHGQLVSDLCRECFDGIFLQLVEPRPGQVPAGTTWLVYLELATLGWERVVETADYYLLPDAPGLEPGAFEGLNPAGEKLELRVQTDD